MDAPTLENDPPNVKLLRPLVFLALPVLAEHTLHILVGMTDAYLANNLVTTRGLAGDALQAAHSTNAAAGAAVGSITYIAWFIGLIVSAIGTGATAIIARATGARHRRLANRICGQSMLGAIVAGAFLGAAVYLAAEPLSKLTGLEAVSAAYFREYVRILSLGFPFAVLMFTANSCLRGAGDTVTPAAAMITVDVVNVVISATLAWGLFGAPRLGVQGIAIGTASAYISGGVLQTIVLLIGRGGIRLYVHRLNPDWHTIKRILRIGIPSGSEGVLMWLANFLVLRTVNMISDTAAASHNVAIRIESISYMSGYAVATAVATTVGQQLGAGRPHLARRAAYLGYALGGGFMMCIGLMFITMGHHLAAGFSDDPAIISQAATCLLITGFVQAPFAGGIIFGSALRGAGDTRAVMILNLFSIIFVRCVGTLIVGHIFHSLTAVWLVLCSELTIRGTVMYLRLRFGPWTQLQV